MGILGLSKLIADRAPGSIQENDIKSYFGRKVAIDASTAIYQFLIAIRQGDQQLTNDKGEVTSHVAGMFYRTVRLVEKGIKPVYVFDGKPPSMKSGELAKRTERREEAEKKLAVAQEAGDQGEVAKYERRLVKMGKKHMEDCQKLLKLMGIPVVLSPTEAESQCAALQKGGKVYGVATEDMDALTFASGRLLRHMTFSEARKMPIQEFDYEKVLEGMDFTHEMFVDLCILLGCDYCESIRGIGPKRAHDLIKEHKSIEVLLTKINKEKFIVPSNWLFKEARELFMKPDVMDAKDVEIKWEQPDVEGVVAYMCEEMGFNEERIRNGLEKMKKAKSKGNQGRINDFFKRVPQQGNNKKRKSMQDNKKNVKKIKTEKKVKTEPKWKKK